MDGNDVLNTPGVVPSYIDASSLVAKRLDLVSDLVDVIRNGGRDHKPVTIMQRLPRHMRRRAMSHNIKRLPRIDREFAVKILAKNTHRNKPPSRLHRRRPKNLQKEYARRSNKGNRWLQTHIWHAKRFEMIKLWDFKIPLRCSQRGVRPFMKAARDGVVIFDDSYCRMLRFRFNSTDQLDIFKCNYVKLRNMDYCSLKELRFSSSGLQQLFSITWSGETTNNYDVILSIHPLFYEKPLELLYALTELVFNELDEKAMEATLKNEYGDELPMSAYKATNCLVTDETNLYSMFSLYGSKIVPRLFERLKLVKTEELDSIDLRNSHDLWKSFCQSGGTINDLKNGTSFTLLAEDPRLSSMGDKNELEKEAAIEDSTKFQSQLKQSCTLFDRRKLNNYMLEAISEERLNQLKSTRVGNIKLKRYKIPVIVSFWNWGSTNHCKFILPANTTRDFFSYFYRCGFRVGALSDRFILCNEIADCAYPFALLPLTIARPLYRWKRYCKFKETIFENFGKWNSLKNWLHVVDNPIRLSYLQSLIDSPRTPVNDSELFKLNDVLVPVRVIINGGNISDDGLIYEWQVNMEDVQSTVTVNEIEESSDDEDPDKFFDDNESQKDEEEVQKPAKFFQECRSHTKAHPNDGSIIGRIAIAEQSHYRGRVEALGYIELNSFIQLRHSSGKVRVRNPNSVKLVDAYVKTLYSQ